MAALFVLAGCATTRPAVPASAPSGAMTTDASGAGDAPGAAAGTPPRPWQVAASSYGSQILYRVSISGSAGDGSVKLTLRLAAADHYQLQVVDPLGRALWGVEVEGDHGLWVDYRSHSYCRLGGTLDLGFLPLGPLSLSALPPLLLGRLPIPPVASPDPVIKGSEITYRDEIGRSWSATVRDGQVLAWSLRPAEGGEPILSWVRSDDWSILSDRRKGVQVRWRQSVREPLPHFTPLAPPKDGRELHCEDLELSAPPASGSSVPPARNPRT
jgi:hypothetical protein